MPPSGARIAATVRADVRALAAYPVAEATGCIKLDAMECPYELPEAVREDIARAVRDTPLNRYPSADLSALQQAVRAAFGVPDAAGLLFGNGSDELIHIAIQACCAPGDVVLSPWPSFVYFDMAARFDHARFVGVPLTEDLSLDLPAMLAAIREHQPAGVPGRAQQSHRRPVAGRTGPGRDRRRARPGGDRRGLPALRRRHLDAARAGSAQRGGHAHRVQDRTGGPALRLPGRQPRLDRRAEQGAPALQPGRADPGRVAGRAAPQAGAGRAGRPPARRPARWPPPWPPCPARGFSFRG